MTSVAEIAPDLYRLCTEVRDAVARVLDPASIRGRRRLEWHYLPLVTSAAVTTAALAVLVDSPVLVYRLSVATAIVGLALFGLSLGIGPIGLLVRGRPLPISTDLRRDVGILAGILSLLHVAIGLMVYPDVRSYFVYPMAEWQRRLFLLRLDDFGAANWTGLAASVILVLLLATSGDWALRRYGARRWKQIQQLAYWAFGIVFVHGVVYQRLDPHPQHALVVIFGIIVAGVVGLQAAGYLAYVARADAPSGRTPR